MKLVFVLTFCFILCLGLQAQDNLKSDFELQLESIITTKPRDFEILDSIFSEFERDTIKMNALIQKSRAFNYLEGESFALNNLGVFYRNNSHYESAINVHKKANALAVEVNNLELRVINLNNIGVVYRRMDLVKPALDFHTKALDIARSIDEPSKEIKYNIAVSQNSIGNIYLVLEQYELAKRQFQKSLSIEKESGNKLGLAINYQNIGFTYEAQGELEEALNNYERSLDYNNQIDSELGRVICYNSIGKVYIQQEKFSAAKTSIEKALEKALKIGDQFYISSSYINLGWAQKHLGLNDLSETNLKRGLDVAKKYSLKLSIVEAQKHLSDLYEMTNKPSLALNAYRDAIALEKTIANDRNLRYVNDVIIQYENEAKNNQIKALADENEIVKSRLERNKKFFWYSILAFLIIGAILFSLYRNRQLQQEKQILTLEQDMLRSQMNPHFIFNSLNSIKLYIINNEKENAVYYLNKFSKFIRKILVASTEKEISLEDELATMKLYMNIENIRFSNEISFDVYVEDNINTASIKVPSMILQPFLENALWHGLSSKKEDDKKIKLNVSQTNAEFVTICIEDNGIGRIRSAEINKGKLLKRKSVGISLTKARLANFSKDFTYDYQIRIEDLYDTNQNAIGTKIIVDIPVHIIAKRTA
ncbi:tetratricopeptide repeat-containing sensor histidine kinase [Psychroserpens ponticola]|uniref:Tetratricopeptide repeat protein n=1 Tax=Psychroserpens ponticola TaxID=2932268 RepID=A0ABY7RXU6_9FLAO|nr:tetratricopeptide repeat protein [Psychroserpens ponticola]WCO01964.1 tetratricopeptide repeat protein [Psychroserpens ponticola]